MERVHVAKNAEPKDVKVAKFSRKLDIVQMAVGAAIIPFAAPIGVGILAFNGVEYVATGYYIKKRTKSHNQHMAKKAA